MDSTGGDEVPSLQSIVKLLPKTQYIYKSTATMAAPMDNATSLKFSSEKVENLTNLDELKKVYDDVCKEEVYLIFTDIFI